MPGPRAMVIGAGMMVLRGHPAVDATRSPRRFVMDVTGLVAGGSFLLTTPAPHEVFVPEDFSDEHRLAAQSLTDFLDAEVEPRTAELETHNFPLVRQLLRRLGALGFLGVDIPE